jgi:hypothetical protein
VIIVAPRQSAIQAAKVAAATSAATSATNQQSEASAMRGYRLDAHSLRRHASLAALARPAALGQPLGRCGPWRGVRRPLTGPWLRERAAVNEAHRLICDRRV